MIINQLALSFVVPAYNEEAFINATLETLDKIFQKQNLPYEIVVVDDGSKDKTLEKATMYAKRNGHVKILSYPQNMGKGYALKNGFMKASGEIVVFADGDLEIDFHTISNYIEALEHSDIVIASKWHPDSRVKIPFSRKMMSHSFHIIVRILTGSSVRDTQAGLKAMRKSAFMHVFPKLAVKRYAFDVELLAVARLCGLKVVEMPVNIKLNASFSLSQVGKMFVDLLGIAYRLRVIHWYQHPVPRKTSLQNFASFIFHGQ